MPFAIGTLDAYGRIRSRHLFAIRINPHGKNSRAIKVRPPCETSHVLEYLGVVVIELVYDLLAALAS